ncbi:AraC family transcriptional regulator [Lelliottia sp. V106_10]|uniref:AraC family transcriptional regulator n=1 Tax=Lelliottia wanjuensis TaxID=3050585 RepID=UPI00254B0CF2|nr:MULTISPECIES: AraC family transcriptional regulator [unclassified Lelliottia]MDK9357437.1 AraC family transcriptional regulator [Lelliottia sp. V106_16]MDK9373071.1 AraC family transcriptional regulator [Lelliottia sp. V106_10]MDK9599875.1 AraC family transcriptional regulator [Lelliottia sp. V106_5]
MNNLLARIEASAEALVSKNEGAETILPYMHIHRFNTMNIPVPDPGEPFLYMVIRGRLQLFNASGISECRQGQYFISPVDVPSSGVFPEAKESESFLALSVNFSLADIIGVILDTEGDTPFERSAGKKNHDDIENTEYLLSILERMLSLSSHPSRVGFMGNHLKRELMFAILTGRFGDALLKGVMNIQNAGDIYQINSWIKQNFRDVFSVQELADKTQMSVSRFHQKFKTAVGMGPLQCQKQLRLSEARRLMLVQDLSVTEAGMEVGYESLSQFIRDYRRQFGLPPHKDIQQLRSATKK